MRVEVLGGIERRRRWSRDDKMRFIQETLAPGAVVTEIARRHGIATSLVSTHVNKVHHVTTITRVAEQLGEDEDWLRDVASEMEIEDGVIWVYGVGEDGVLAFTDFAIESLIELIKMYKDDPTLLKRYDPQ